MTSILRKHVFSKVAERKKKQKKERKNGNGKKVEKHLEKGWGFLF